MIISEVKMDEKEKEIPVIFLDQDADDSKVLEEGQESLHCENGVCKIKWD